MMVAMMKSDEVAASDECFCLARRNRRQAVRLGFEELMKMVVGFGPGYVGFGFVLWRWGWACMVSCLGSGLG